MMDKMRMISVGVVPHSAAAVDKLPQMPLFAKVAMLGRICCDKKKQKGTKGSAYECRTRAFERSEQGYARKLGT